MNFHFSWPGSLLLVALDSIAFISPRLGFALLAYPLLNHPDTSRLFRHLQNPVHFAFCASVLPTCIFAPCSFSGHLALTFACPGHTFGSPAPLCSHPGSLRFKAFTFSLSRSGLCTCILCLEGSALRGGYCHDRDIQPHPVHPQSHLHTALFALNSPHPNPIHIQTRLPPVLAFACILQHLRRLCKHARRAAIPLHLARTSLTNREHSRSNANHGTRSQARVSKHNSRTRVRARALPLLLTISPCSSFVFISASLVPGLTSVP